ncbi:MAG: EamA family transporter [Candidatus Latescibacteria bacterium]|nr:EamA family transporter [Candidatus Latescibacterota bacterium]
MTRARLYLWISVLIFAAAAAVVARLVEVGQGHLIDGRNPISFCNLLFAGNLVAALCLLAIYHRECRPAELKKLSPRQWLVQLGLAITSGALAPALMFTAIARTSVTNIALIETVEIPLGLLFAWLLYREKSTWGAVLGACCALLGVVATLGLQMDAAPQSMVAAGMQGGPGSGELYAVIATLITVFGSEIGRKQLQTIPLGIFSVFRNLVGALSFLGLGLYLFGLDHFADIFSPVLWVWMLFYGGVIVACGQITWFAGIKRVRPADIATASAFSPIAGVLFAMLLLDEVPMSAQLIGGAIIAVGIAIGLWSEMRAGQPTRPPKPSDKAKAFTGV